MPVRTFRRVVHFDSVIETWLTADPPPVEFAGLAILLRAALWNGSNICAGRVVGSELDPGRVTAYSEAIRFWKVTCFLLLEAFGRSMNLRGEH